MTRAQLTNRIKVKRSFLCIGLDADIKKIPDSLLSSEDPIFEFNKQIIDATADLCIAYKPNTAFYECNGEKGWKSLKKTWQYFPKDIFSIADAKRGDIGNTSEMYARAFFDETQSGMSFDSITVAPYMGADSVKPFLNFSGKWAIVLALTSNAGSSDFQMLNFDNKHLYELVLQKVSSWGSAENIMFVVGATQGKAFEIIRRHCPEHFLLVPGVGAQGGSLEDVCNYGMNKDCGLIVNASRSIIYASNGKDFAERAREEALKIQQEMANQLEKFEIV